MRPSIMICIPTTGNISKYLNKWLLYIAATQSKKYRISVAINTAKPVISNRNHLTHIFLSSDYDYSFWCDDDIIPPYNILDLVNFNVPVVGGICFVSKGKNLVHLALERVAEKKYKPLHPTKFRTPLTEVDATGSGAIFIHRTIFEQLDAPWWEDNSDEFGVRDHGHDFNLCMKIRDIGQKIYVAPNVACSHITNINLLTMKDLLITLEKQVGKINIGNPDLIDPHKGIAL